MNSETFNPFATTATPIAWNRAILWPRVGHSSPELIGHLASARQNHSTMLNAADLLGSPWMRTTLLAQIVRIPQKLFNHRFVFSPRPIQILADIQKVAKQGERGSEDNRVNVSLSRVWIHFPFRLSPMRWQTNNWPFNYDSNDDIIFYSHHNLLVACFNCATYLCNIWPIWRWYLASHNHYTVSSRQPFTIKAMPKFEFRKMTAN